MVGVTLKKRKGKEPEDLEIGKDGEPLIFSRQYGVYPRAIKKIASYSGTTRVAKCNDPDRCNGFDEFINIYVDENGYIIDDYNKPDNKIMNLSGSHDILPDNVKHKDRTFWGNKNVKSMKMEYRKKKQSKPMQRKTKKSRRK